MYKFKGNSSLSRSHHQSHISKSHHNLELQNSESEGIPEISHLHTPEIKTTSHSNLLNLKQINLRSGNLNPEHVTHTTCNNGINHIETINHLNVKTNIQTLNHSCSYNKTEKINTKLNFLNLNSCRSQGMKVRTRS